ncbi:hypothetical protein [Chitinimonas sp.]|uniref:hypothetical protein n=1 Tax=Chitinimonas sp. TaxID=1934313 RepID=UPI0035B15562
MKTELSFNEALLYASSLTVLQLAVIAMALAIVPTDGARMGGSLHDDSVYLN